MNRISMLLLKKAKYSIKITICDIIATKNKINITSYNIYCILYILYI